MKKLVVTLLASLALASSVLAQGTINLNNLLGPGGLVYDSNGTTPYNQQFTVALYGGASAGSLTLLGTFTSPAGLSGIIFSGNDYIVPGVTAGSVGTFQLLGFAGANAFSSVAAGQAALVKSGTSGIWTQATGGTGAPPGPGTDMLNPAVVLALAPVPEPTTLALAGMGARQKKY